MFIEPPVPLSILECPWVRIGDHRVSRSEDIDPKTGLPRALTEKRVSFYVHVDELASVPPEVRHTTLGVRLPTVASLERAKRAQAGVRDVGDEIAQILRPCENLDAVYAVAAEYLATDESVLREKYGKLNPGQQRMNLGNRMRFKWRKTHA